MLPPGTVRAKVEIEGGFKFCYTYAFMHSLMYTYAFMYGCFCLP